MAKCALGAPEGAGEGATGLKKFKMRKPQNKKPKKFFLVYRKGKYILENISLKKKGRQQKFYI
jgi:hypothetical protein